MGLFLQVFRRLDSPSAPSFQLCVSVLDCVSQVPLLMPWHPLSVGDQSNVHGYPAILLLHMWLSSEAVLVVQTKCCLLALDFETSDYTCDLFSVILDVLR